MTSNTSDRVYEIHLTEGVADVPAKVTSPRLEFYDSGVWADNDDETRDFFPYHRIEFIREKPTPAASADEDTEKAEMDTSPEQHPVE
ncbi:hypothetical protein VB773_17430 [Haloarculaceae archaeon H-GB2-1]|nr:hypothetical protein [Haloarculaceae archaeon H-GB1-1]MEA5387687.1 hypothetical protein [Haloarculaceae archaeon H-GB11]MEA5409176.1 hypothetical protein [Haloarculaceae archaeon H-GB2-1]